MKTLLTFILAFATFVALNNALSQSLFPFGRLGLGGTFAAVGANFSEYQRRSTFEKRSLNIGASWVRDFVAPSQRHKLHPDAAGFIAQYISRAKATQIDAEARASLNRKRSISNPALAGAYPIGETSGLISNLGRNGGNEADSWSVFPYVYQGAPVDPTMGGLGRQWTGTIIFPADASDINDDTPFAVRIGFPAFFWQACGMTVGYAAYTDAVGGVHVAPGTWPLGADSPGYGGAAWPYSGKLTALAEDGVIMFGTDFVPGDGNFINETDTNETSVAIAPGTILALTLRAQDISIDYTYMINRSNTVGDLFYHHINSSKVICTGHSFGGAACLGLVTGPVNIRGNLGYNITIDTRITDAYLEDASDWEYNCTQDTIHRDINFFLMNSVQAGGECGMRAFMMSQSLGWTARVRMARSLHLSFVPDVCGVLEVLQLPNDTFANCDPEALDLILPSIAQILIQGYHSAFFLLTWPEGANLLADVEDVIDYGSYFVPNCVAYWQNGTFDLFPFRTGATLWTVPTSPYNNLGFGAEGDYLANQSADLEATCFDEYFDQDEVIPFGVVINCESLAPSFFSS